MLETKVNKDVYGYLLSKAIDHTRVGVTITDPNQEDNPIVFVNDGFTTITGYERDEILGKNCRFLQGEKTDKEHVRQIKEAIQNRESISIEVLNYTKEGKPFWNSLHIEPIYIEEEKQYYFIGTQKDISAQRKVEEDLKTSHAEITALSTPIVPIADGVSVLPIIGNMDQERLHLISDNITKKMAETKDHTLIVELSGLNNFDEELIVGIFRLSDVIALLGGKLIITGISPEFAMKSTQLGIDLSSIKTYSTVKEAVELIEPIKQK